VCQLFRASCLIPATDYLCASQTAPKAGWIPHPGDLLLIHLIAAIGRKKVFGRTNATIFADGGVPFLVHQTDELVSEVLERLGYIHKRSIKNENAFAEALFTFWERSTKYLAKAGIQVQEIEAEKVSKREASIYKAFAKRIGRQQPHFFFEIVLVISGHLH